MKTITDLRKPEADDELEVKRPRDYWWVVFILFMILMLLTFAYAWDALVYQLSK